MKGFEYSADAVAGPPFSMKDMKGIPPILSSLNELALGEKMDARTSAARPVATRNKTAADGMFSVTGLDCGKFNAGIIICGFLVEKGLC